MPRRLLLAVPVLLTLVIGGCSNSKVEEANAYVAAVNRVQADFAAESTRLILEIAPEDPARARRAALDRLYGVVDRFVGELRSIEPPARVRSLHERLVSAGVRFGGRLRAAGSALTSDDAGRILDGQERLAEAGPGMTRSVNGTIAAINAELAG